MQEIINRVANSKLQIFDLEDYFPKEKTIGLDVSQWLEEGFLLKEKEFRTALQNHNWENYTENLVYLFCSTDAILPAWSFALVTTYLQKSASKIVLGNQKDLILQIYTQKLETIDYSMYQDQVVILKGCAIQPVPSEMYVLAIQKLMPFAKSIMFGEACSAVPLFKR